MAEETPGPTPEGRLIEEAAKATGRSIRQLAANAGISDTRWRQIVRGWQENSAGKVIPSRASAPLLARMAYVVDLDTADLVDAGRTDAAEALAKLRRMTKNAAALSFAVSRDDHHDVVLRNEDGTKTFIKVDRIDEIDLIYASRMSAREKLLRIRQVLELRALAEAEEAAQRKAAPAEEAGADEQEKNEAQQS